MENYIVAIDLGTSHARLVVGQCDEKKPYGLNVVSTETQRSQGMKRGAVYSKDDVIKVVKNLILGADKKINAGRRRTANAPQPSRKVCVNISGLNFQTSIVREKVSLQSAPVSLRTLKYIETQAINNQMQYATDDQVTRVVPLGYSIDNEPDTDDVLGHVGGILEAKFLCFKSKQKDLALLSSVFPTTHRPEAFYASTSAKAAVVLASQPHLMRDGVLLVDLGYGTTGVAAYSRGALRYEVSIPIGSETITTDIEQALDIANEDAEYLKCNVGIIDEAQARKSFEVDVPSGGTVSFEGAFFNMVIKARVEEIAAYVFAAYKEAQKRGCRDVKMVLTGGGAHLSRVGEVLEAATGIPVVALPPLSVGLSFSLDDYAGALGMASIEARNFLAQLAMQPKQQQLPIEEVADEGEAAAPEPEGGRLEADEAGVRTEPEEDRAAPVRRNAAQRRGAGFLAKMGKWFDGAFDDENNSKSN